MESTATGPHAPFVPVFSAKLIRIEELADEIGELAAYLNAANCRLMKLIAEFDQLGGYTEQGAKSTAHWLNWKCGIGLNAAREKVRTARALTALPKIQASFAAGRISYSKVRAMTRVATPENESYLLDIALYGTASHVEKLVRGYRWRIRHDEEREEDRKRQDNRYCHYHWDAEGCLIVTARLTPEQGALLIKALEAGQEMIEADVTAVTSGHPPQVNVATPQANAATSQVNATTPQAEHVQSKGTPEPGKSHASSFPLPSGEGAREGESRATFPLPSGEGAGGRGQISHQVCSLRGLPPTPTLPPVGGGSSEGKISEWTGDVTAVTLDGSKAADDVTAVTPGYSSELASEIAAENLETSPAAERPRRRADALTLMAETLLAHGPAAMNGGDKHQVILIAGDDVLSGTSDTGACRLEDGPNIGIETMRRLGCDAAIRKIELDRAGEPVNIGRKSRTIPPPMRRAMLLRDGGCRFPGCTQSKWVDGHHIEHWSRGGETSLDNLVTLCRHHHRLIHEGGFTVCRARPNCFEFKSPRGNVIPDAAPPSECVATPHFAGSLDKDTAACGWDGESMDYCEAVLALQDADGRLKH